MTIEQVEQMTVDNAVAIGQLTAATETLSKDIDRVVKLVENQEVHSTKIEHLERRVGGLEALKGKLGWAVAASWVGLLTYGVKIFLGL